ncbi:putative metal-binding motif-containing protein [Lutibacter sp. TH_r2]|uniref:putative metal-binding motif-containing protein n=1 Tax=Lutibacter sp. TH_r2 TaxID=3082083 RepID=UPI002953CD2B|nr:putative metal-binding motif-containing protein [Lutibacter sp. TH_r2]MDV7187672.1 putative metal-binding motif-containing protein [Lutibacter sp. TH_r2]
MKKRIINIGIPLTLLVVAIFIIGPACSGEPTYRWYPDMDDDGYADTSATPIEAYLADQPAGYIRGAQADCDDTNADVYPGATEIPDNLTDEDCNGKIAITFYADKDEDGFGNPDSPVIIEIDDYNNDDAPNGYSWVAGDCDDSNVAINPLAEEIYNNGMDDNCNGETDIDDVKYKDADGDGYGSTTFADGDGGVSNNLDCDDSNAKVHPYAKEVLDGLDNDCDGTIDEISF